MDNRAAWTIPSGLIRLGDLGESAAGLPGCVTQNPLKFLWFPHLPAGREAAMRVCESMLIQAVLRCSEGAGVIRFHESVPSALSFRAVKRLFTAAEFGSHLINRGDCRECMISLEEDLHRRSAALAQSEASTLAEFNRRAARPFAREYLLLSGFGAGFSDAETLHRLRTLCVEGPRVGIIPVLFHEKNEGAFSRNEREQELWNDFFREIASHAQGFLFSAPEDYRPFGHSPGEWELLTYHGLSLRVDDAETDSAVRAIRDRSKSVEATRGETDFISVRIGVNEGNLPVSFELGAKSNVYHALIGGATRSGKSMMLRNILLCACEAISPDDLTFTLLDFNQGVSLGDFEGSPHLSQLYVSDGGNHAAAADCLRALREEMFGRYALLREARVMRIEDLPPAGRPPRHLLVVEEAQNLFAGDPSLRREIEQLIADLAKRGAAVGIHLILSTQTYENLNFPDDVKGQFHLRIGLRSATARACYALMGRDNDAMIDLPRYSAVYNASMGEAGANLIVALDELSGFGPRIDALKARFTPLEPADEPPLP